MAGAGRPVLIVRLSFLVAIHNRWQAPRPERTLARMCWGQQKGEVAISGVLQDANADYTWGVAGGARECR